MSSKKLYSSFSFFFGITLILFKSLVASLALAALYNFNSNPLGCSIAFFIAIIIIVFYRQSYIIIYENHILFFESFKRKKRFEFADLKSVELPKEATQGEETAYSILSLFFNNNKSSIIRKNKLIINFKNQKSSAIYFETEELIKIADLINDQINSVN